MANSDQDFNSSIAETARLAGSGVLGFYTHIEVIEVFAYREGENTPLNVFSILVAEERIHGNAEEPRDLGPRIN